MYTFFIYRKISSKKFPTKFEVLDRLIALTMLYGSSINMQSAQIQYFKSYKDNIPKPSKRLHGHPTSYSDDAEKEKHELEKSLRIMVRINIIKYFSQKLILKGQNSVALIGDVTQYLLKLIIDRRYVNIILEYGNLDLTMHIGLKHGHAVRENGRIQDVL